MSIAAIWAELRSLVETGRLERAFDLASQLYDGTPEAQHVAQRALAAILPRLSRCAISPARAVLAHRLGLPLPPTRDRVGQLDFPAVCGDLSRFVTAYVGDAADTDRVLPAGLPAKTQASIRDALQAVRSLTGSTQHLEVMLDAEVSGRSCGLAVALAAYSHLTGQPLSDRLAATGRLFPDGCVAEVSDIPLKLRLRAEARPGCTLLVPHDAEAPHEQIIRIRSLQHAIELLSGPAGPDFEATYQKVRGQFRQGAWLQAAEQAELIHDHPAATEAERISLLTILLCAANHTGRAVRAAEIVDKLDKLLQQELVQMVAGEALASCLVTAVDSFQLESAHIVVGRIAKHAWSASDLIHLRGAQALLAVYEDRIADAVHLRRQNSFHATADERPRCLGDLADALRRLGELDEALHTIEEALALLRQTNGRRHGYQRQTQPFLHLHAARIHRARGEFERALHYLHSAVPSIGPDPSLRLGLELILAAAGNAAETSTVSPVPAELASHWNDRPALHDSDILRALYLRARIEAGDQDCVPALAAIMRLPADAVTPAALCRRLPY